MSSYLDGKLRKLIAKGFKGKLKKGLIRNYTNGQLDDYGDQSFSDDPEEAKFEGIKTNFNASWAASAGIPETDVSILVLLGSVKPQSVEPAQDSLIYIDSQWHKTRKVLEVDPANATVRLQCYVMTPQPFST